MTLNTTRLRRGDGGPTAPYVRRRDPLPDLVADIRAAIESGREWHYIDVSHVPSIPVYNHKAGRDELKTPVHLLTLELRRAAHSLGRRVAVSVRPGTTPDTRTVYVRVRPPVTSAGRKAAQ